MSEPSSFYLRFPITKANYDAMMQSPVVFASHFNDWQQWFNSQLMYGDRTITAEHLYDTFPRTFEEDLSEYFEEEKYGAYSEYNEEQQIWEFCVLFFSENYYEMLQMMTPFRGAATFCQPDKQGLMVIYPHVFGGDNEHNAMLIIDNAQSTFVTELNPEYLEKAYSFVEKTFNVIAENFKDFED